MLVHKGWDTPCCTPLHARPGVTYCASHSLAGTGTASSDCRPLSFAASLPSLTVLALARFPRCLWLGPFSHWSGCGLRLWSHWMRTRRIQTHSLFSFFLIWISSCSSESALSSAACARRNLPSWRSWSWSWSWGWSVCSSACSGFCGHCATQRHPQQRQSGGCWCSFLGNPAVRYGHSGCSSGRHPQSLAPGCSAGRAQVCSSRPR